MNTSVVQSTDLYRLIQGPYQAIYEQVLTALKAAGFEIMAEINLAQSIGKVTQSFIQPYQIVIACNLDIAHRALTISPDVGMSLPCHVGISQTQDNLVEVRIADPNITWNVASRHYLKPIAEELFNRLEQVIQALER